MPTEDDPLAEDSEATDSPREDGSRPVRLDEQLLQAAYGELRGLANVILQGERPGHTLQATALANEAWVKLDHNESARYGSKQHFLAVAARAMRQILVDHARRRGAAMRGGNALRLTLVDDAAGSIETEQGLDILALEDALERLEILDPRGAQIVELRFFGGMSETEVAEHLDVSRRTVSREWRLARAWLAEALGS